MDKQGSVKNEDMPRERLLKHGASALADYELLAILLKTGIKGKDVLTLAREILQQQGGLVGLLSSNHEQLKQIKGLGNAKISIILTVVELARRFVASELRYSDWVFNDAVAVRDFLLMHYKGLKTEQLGVLLLDQQHRFLAYELLATGGVEQVQLPMRKLLQVTLDTAAAAAILVHNHPALSVQASAADITATQQVEKALVLLEVRLLDHFIVAGNEIVSLKEQGGW